MSDYGIKVVKVGADIESTDLNDYIFHSSYPTQCIKERGNIQITTPYVLASPTPIDPNTAVYTHNFGYIPQFIAFTRSYLSENYSKWAYADYIALDFDVTHVGVGSYINEAIKAYATDTEIVISAVIDEFISGAHNGIEHTFTVDLLLFMEEASL